jgi:Fe-S-cluster containining protein
MDQREISRIFFRDGYRLAQKNLDGEPGTEGLKEAIQELYGAVDGLLESFLDRSAAEGKPAACREKCAWCCHQAVFAVTHEILYLRDHVQSHFLPGEQDAFMEKARDKTMLTAHKPLEEKLLVRAPCPFLLEGSCSVYPSRPMACRIYLSSSEASCRMEFDEPGNTIPELFEFPLRAGRMMNEGFVAFLKQIGLPTEEWPLEEGYFHVAGSGRTMETWMESRSRVGSELKVPRSSAAG